MTAWINWIIGKLFSNKLVDENFLLGEPSIVNKYVIKRFNILKVRQGKKIVGSGLLTCW